MMTNALIFFAVLLAWIFGTCIVGTLVGGLTWIIARPTLRPAIPAFALQAGYVITSVLALFALFIIGDFTAAATLVVLLTLIVVVAMLLWFILRPGPAPAIVLTVFHILDFSLACLQGGGSSSFIGLGALVASFLLRATSIALMVVGVWMIRKTQRAVLQPSLDPLDTIPVSQL